MPGLFDNMLNWEQSLRPPSQFDMQQAVMDAEQQALRQRNAAMPMAGSFDRRFGADSPLLSLLSGGGQNPAAAPAAQSPADQGLLAAALQLAAQNSGALSRNQTMRGGPGGTFHGDVLESSGPLQAQPWYDEYLAAGQAGADLPMVRGSGAPMSDAARAGIQARRDERLSGTLPMAERRANVRSNAIAQRAARHGRMGIPDNGMQMDLLSRLQEMDGGQAADPMSMLGYARNRAALGPEAAGGMMEGGFRLAQDAAKANTRQMELMMATAIAIKQDPMRTPQNDQMADRIIQQFGGLDGGGQMAPQMEAGPASPFLPGRAVNENPMSVWQGPGTNPATLTDTLNAFGGMDEQERTLAYEKGGPLGSLMRMIRESTGYQPQQGNSQRY